MKVLACLAVWLLVVGLAAAGHSIKQWGGLGEWLAVGQFVGFIIAGFMWEWLNNEN